MARTELRLAGAGPAVRAGSGGCVVLCGANPWDGVRLADQQLAVRLADHFPVLYVDPPISRLTPRRRPAAAATLAQPRLRRLGPRLSLLTPVVLPGMERPGMNHVTAALTRRAIRGALRALGGGPARAVVATSALVHTLGAAGEPLRVYWAQDDYAGGAELFGVQARRIRRGEARLAAKANLLVAANPLVADAWRARGRDDVVLIPYGCDAAAFAAAERAPLPADVDLPRPVAGFMGHVGDRIDLALLEAVAERGHSLLLVGPRHPRFQACRLEGLLARPNVRWVGPKPFEKLPSYLRVMDAGLLPYTDSAFNRGSFPLKTLEYLAAGLGVVATDLPAVRWLGTDLITVASGPRPYADAVERALAAPRSPALVARRRAFAAGHDWASRAEAFAGALRHGAPPEGGR